MKIPLQKPYGFHASGRFVNTNNIKFYADFDHYLLFTVTVILQLVKYNDRAEGRS